MQSKFYQPDEQRAEKVRQLFATIARRYDLLNDLMSLGLHRRWKRRVVELADVERRASSVERPRVLDLCCGTGDIARMFEGKVVGADFTHEMLRVAQTRSSTGVPPVWEMQKPDTRARRPCHLFWIRADALRLPFPDDSFDVITVGYGLRNLADVEAGLREIYRVLRPGGKFLSLDFGKPKNSLLRWFYFAYLRTVVPVLGRLFCGDRDTHAYILISLQHYGAQRGIQELMELCGYRDCGFEEFVGGTMAINFGCKAPPAR